MARDYPGVSTTDYLTLPASTDWDFNTDVCIWTIIKVDAGATLNSTILAIGVDASNGFQSFYDTNRALGFTKILVVDILSTIIIPTGVWVALQSHGTDGGDSHFKMYRFDNNVLTTETISNAAALNIPSNDPGRIGNWLVLNNDFAVNGQIDRVVLLQADPSDGEFIHWANTGQPIRPVIYNSIQLGRSPEIDFSGNNNDAIVTGTTVVDSAPVAPSEFGFELGWEGAFAVAAAGGHPFRRPTTNQVAMLVR